MSGDYPWNQLEFRSLAKVVDPRDLPVELRLAEVNRLDLLGQDGPEKIAAQVYAAIAASGVNYELEPLSQIRNEQRIRMPRKILSDKRATCLDLAVLFAAACLQQELLSVLVLLEDHALAGIALLKTQRYKDASLTGAWRNGLLDDLVEARDLIQSGELLVVECTGMVSSQSLRMDKPEGQGRKNGKLTFEQACQMGAAQILDHAVSRDEVWSPRQRRFRYLLHVYELQTQQGFAPDPAGSATEREIMAWELAQVKEALDTVKVDTTAIRAQLEAVTADLRKLSALPVGYDSVVADFLDYYLGAPEEPEPFGGREAVLADLTRWLDDRTVPRYAVLEAPAGRGKSAVVAHWVASLAGRSDWAVAFVPISERFDSNAASAIFQTLYGRLVYLHGETPTRQDSTEDYRVACREYLRKPLPDGRRLLVVLDGLDEAVGWGTKTGLFPTKAPDHLKVLVAARTIAGDQSWLEQLGWTGKRQARVFGLDNLTRSGVQEVLHRKGDPLGGMADSDGLLDKLYHLTQQGDPLLVRLYVDALRTDQRQESELTPGDLDRIEPGLDGYFKDWYPRQQAMWEKGKEQVDKDAVAELLNLRAMAHGPLSAQDVFMLAPVFFRTPEAVQRTAEAVRRFLIGDGSRDRGYSFNHPRFTEYFRSKLEPVRQLEYQRRYLAYGAETLQSLNAGTLPPGATSRYIVRNYRIHLEEAARPTGELCALMSKGWLRAWQALEDNESGFLVDVQAAMDRAAKDGPEWLGKVIRGALCLSSIRSIGAQARSKLIANAVSKRALGLQAGLLLTRNVPDLRERVVALLALSNVFGETGPNDFLSESLKTAQQIRNDARRADTLSLVAHHLPNEAARPILIESLAIVREIRDARIRAETLSAVVERIPTCATDLLGDAMTVACEIADEWWCAQAVGAVAVRLPESAQDLFGEALAVTRKNIVGDVARAEALRALGAKLPLGGHDLFRAVLDMARGMTDDRWRVAILDAISHRLPADAPELTSEALAMVANIRNEGRRAELLSTVAERLPADACDLLGEALAEVRKFTMDDCRLSPLMAIAARLPATKPDLISEALAVARELRDVDYRTQALISVAVRLPGDESKPVLKEALAVARSEGWDVASRVAALSRIAKLLPADEAGPILNEVLVELSKHPITWPGFDAICALTELLPTNEACQVLGKALADVRMIHSEDLFSQSMIAIAKRLPVDAHDLLAEALRVVEEWPPKESFDMLDLRSRKVSSDIVQFEKWQVDTLIAVLMRLPADAQELLDLGLAAANRIMNEELRVRALTTVIARLPAHGQDLLKKGFVAACGVRDEALRATALIAVAARLPEDAHELLVEVLTAAREISDGRRRGEALNALAEHLPVGAHDVQTMMLEAAREIGDSLSLIETLAALAKYLEAAEAKSVLEGALVMAQGISDDATRAKALISIAASTPTNASHLLGDALTMLSSITDEEWRASALCSVVGCIPTGAHEILRQALTETGRFKNEEYRSRALCAMGMHFAADPEGTFFEALALARGINENRAQRVMALTGIAARLSADQSKPVLDEALEVVREFGLYDGKGIKELAQIARLLPTNEAEQVLDEALVLARRYSNAGERARHLSIVAESLPTNHAVVVLNEALVAANQELTANGSAHWLRDVAAHLPSEARESLAEVLQMSDTISDIYDRIGVLRAVVPRLPKGANDLIANALACARGLGNATYRAEVLCTVAKALPPSEAALVLDEVLELAWSISDNQERNRVMKAVVALVPESAFSLLRKALAAVRETTDELWRAELLSTISNRLPADHPELLSEAMAIARAMDEENYLYWLCRQTDRWRSLAMMCHCTESGLLTQSFHSIHSVRRQALLESIVKFIPIIVRTSGTATLREIGSSVCDTAEWWP